MKQDELCSMGFIETETSLTSILPEGRETNKRFRRSQSGQRSRSKENLRFNDPSFFVKNIFPQKPVPVSPEKPRYTPQKSKRMNNHIPNKQDQSGRKWGESSMLKKCNQLNKLLESSHSYILELQKKISQLQDELKKKNIGGEKVGREGKVVRSNLALLRKQIAQTRIVQPVSSQFLTQQVKILHAENLNLREQISILKASIKQQEEIATNYRSKIQNQLEQLINSLREALQASKKREQQLKLQVGMLRLRESKLNDNQQQSKNEQLTFMRFRYEKLRKDFQRNRKALEALQRKQESATYLSSHEDCEISFCLSP